MVVLQGWCAFCIEITAESLGLHLKIISEASLLTLFHMFSQSKWKTYLGNVELGVHHQAQYAQLHCSTLPNLRLQCRRPHLHRSQAPKNSLYQKSNQVPPLLCPPQKYTEGDKQDSHSVKFLKRIQRGQQLL